MVFSYSGRLPAYDRLSQGLRGMNVNGCTLQRRRQWMNWVPSNRGAWASFDLIPADKNCTTPEVETQIGEVEGLASITAFIACEQYSYLTL